MRANSFPQRWPRRRAHSTPACPGDQKPPSPRPSPVCDSAWAGFRGDGNSQALGPTSLSWELQAWPSSTPSLQSSPHQGAESVPSP